MPPTIDPATLERLSAIHQANLALARAFESHPAYASQSTQRSGKIYFMWDFATRTNAMFESILNNTPPPDTPATRDSVPIVPPASMNEGQRKELVNDAVGRCVMLHQMIMDTTGMSAMMFGEAPGRGVDIGDAVKTAANNVNAVISGRQ